MVRKWKWSLLASFGGRCLDALGTSCRNPGASLSSFCFVVFGGALPKR